MAPILDKSPICGITPPETPCFYYIQYSTVNGGDPNWNAYKITSYTLGIDFCSNIVNPADPSGGGIYNFAQSLGINGISDWYFSAFSGPAIGGILSYYGVASQQSGYTPIITNSLNTVVSSGWVQGFSCTPKCFEHSFKKPNFVVRKIQTDSTGNIDLDFLPTGSSPWSLDMVIGADIANLEKILQNIYGPQVTVTTQSPPSGNLILRISNIYTDQITVTLSDLTTHVMTEVPCG